MPRIGAASGVRIQAHADLDDQSKLTTRKLGKLHKYESVSCMRPYASQGQTGTEFEGDGNGIQC